MVVQKTVQIVIGHILTDEDLWASEPPHGDATLREMGFELANGSAALRDGSARSIRGSSDAGCGTF